MRRRIPALVTIAALIVTLAPGHQAATAEPAKQARSAATDWIIHTKTGNGDGAGTDAHVYVQLHGTQGRRTGYIELDRQAHDDFERGSVDTFAITTDDLGDLTWICLRVDDAGLFPDWTVEWVDAIPQGGRRFVAVFNGRMPVNKRICRRTS